MTAQTASSPPAVQSCGKTLREAAEQAVAAPASEEVCLQIAHYRAEFERLAIVAGNCARSTSTDVTEWRADMANLVAQASRFLAA